MAQSISNDLEKIKIIFSELILMEFIDGLTFSQQINTELIAKDAKYEGIRVKITSFLERSKYELLVDIGFSDELSSAAKEIIFPVLLSDFKNPSIKVYPPEQIIAEKFEAMVKLYTQNSRLKDFYDIDFISEKILF